MKKFEQAVRGFLYKLRSYNPNAYIIWAYGMLGDAMLAAINRGIDYNQAITRSLS